VHIPRKFKLKPAILLATPLLFITPLPSFAQSGQLEEIVVTAQRRETNLQETPMSVTAFSADELTNSGIQSGSELGIMVPNVVLNAGIGQGQSDFYIRGLPGVGVYIDGVWQGGFGFQQTNFTEMERVEVLRGPQGTLFGRNTNGGAINITTTKPADEFGARVNLGVGEFNRRDITAAIDVPLSDTLKTKWMVSSLQNDGFLEGITIGHDFGGQDDFILRGDILWEPTDTFSARFTINDEEKSSSDGRIVRFTNTDHVRHKALNILAGNPDFLSAVRAVDPAFPDPPKTLIEDSFGPLTHESGFPGGEVGEWQTKSDGAEDGIRTDLSYYTLTLDWSPSEYFSAEAIFSTWELDRRQVIDFDGSNFVITTDDIRNEDENTTMEFHFTGSLFDDRANWLLGYYSLEQETKARFYRWALWDFVQPNTGPVDPSLDISTMLYVRSYGAAIGDAALESYFPIAFITSDALTGSKDEDTAWFGEFTYAFTDQLEATVGIRITDDSGSAQSYTPSGAFRTTDPKISPSGNSFAGALLTSDNDADLGSITTNKFAVSYQHTDDMMFYANWGEGFTSGGLNNVNNVGLVRLDPEVVTTWEVGLRSDWMDGTLRFNATYFDSDWEGMRVNQLPPDPDNPGSSLPFPYPTSSGIGEASGIELDITYLPADNLILTLGVGLIDTAYIERGTFDGTNGISPTSPFAYAADDSFTLGAVYNMDLSNGADLALSAKYGWTGEYVRDAAFQRIRVDASNNIIMEPSYGILNGRVTYTPQEGNWDISLWGNNLTDEQYINGGFDTKNVWGYDFSVVGRSREIGISASMTF
jgi:iron complex outermembrane recepter protein